MAADSSCSSSTPMDEQTSAASSTSTVITNGTEPSSSDVIPTKEEALKLALSHLVQGKRHLLIKDIGSAIVALGESCQILTETNGPLCSDNAEAHFYYGKALLEQSRLDLGVFEAAPSTEKESSDGENDEDEEEEEEEESDEAMQKDGNEAEAEPKETEKMEEEVESSETKKEEDLNIPSPTTNTIESSGGIVDSEKPSTSSGANGVEKEAEEELSNLELAWEVLEVAKIGYSAQIDLLTAQVDETKTEDEKEKRTKSIKNLRTRLAETHSLLGEVATESENYVQAVEDFKIGIKILSEIEGPASREVAQYYFQMGLAYAFGKCFDDAIGSFKTAKDIIESRIANLAFKIENKQTAKDLGIELEDPNLAEDIEVAELQALVPELEEKINDTIDADRENKATLEEEVKEREIILKSSPVKNPNPPAANDISHLVKKKKKADDDIPSDAPPAKRICNEADVTTKDEVTSSNGHGGTHLTP